MKQSSDYQKGYRAGRHKTAKEIGSINSSAKYNELYNQIFLIMLPIAMQAQGWTINDKAVHSGDDRTELARIWTDRAIKKVRV